MDSRKVNLRGPCAGCRTRGCRVYAELDTLVADSERAAADFVRSACEAGSGRRDSRGLGAFIAAARAVAPLMRVFAGRGWAYTTRRDWRSGAAGRGPGRAPSRPSCRWRTSRPWRGAAAWSWALRCRARCARPGRPGKAITGRERAGAAPTGETAPGSKLGALTLGGRMDDYPLSLKDMSGLTISRSLRAPA